MTHESVSAAITALERSLHDHEPSVETLERLLELYGSTPRLSRHPRRAEHVVALIRLDPLNAYHKTPATYVDPTTHRAAYDEGVRLWRARLTAEPDSVHTTVRAASFIAASRPDEARDMLRAFHARRPGEPEILLALAGLAEDVRTKLEYLELALAAGSAQPNLKRWIAKCALDAGELDKAADLAQGLLTGGASGAQGVNDHHWAHTILGVLALRRGDTADALGRLERSLDEGAEFRMRSYGPAFDLARELCAAGRHAEVAAYCRRCEAFWPTAALRKWIAQLEQGESPSFVIAWEEE